MKFDYIIICTYGRSGSTLLQGILNSCESIFIRGENYNFIYALYHSYVRLKATKELQGYKIQASETTSPWYGANEINLQRYLLDLKNTIDNVLIGESIDRKKNSKTLGFKEIRFLEVAEEEELNEYLLFLKNIFPNCAIIFNIRNIEQTIYSGWWAQKNPKKSRKLLSNFIKMVERFHLENSNTFIINYEDVIIKNSNLKKLFSFLEIPYNPEKIDETLQTNHSYSPRDKLQKDKRITYTHPFYLNNLIDFFKINFFDHNNETLHIKGELRLKNDENNHQKEIYLEIKVVSKQQVGLPQKANRLSELKLEFDKINRFEFKDVKTTKDEIYIIGIYDFNKGNNTILAEIKV